MSLFDRLFGGSGGAKKSVAVSIGAVIKEVEAAAAELDGNELSTDVALARFQDALRSRGLAPTEVRFMRPRFEEPEARARLLLIGALIEGPALTEAIGALGEHAAKALSDEAWATAEKKHLLTLEVIRKSPVRAEELARAFLMQAEMAIAGESEAVSKERLARIDYEELLAEAERAQKSAEERLEELRKLQDLQGRPRGKW